MTQPNKPTQSPRIDNGTTSVTASPVEERKAAAKHHQDVTKGLGGISWRFLTNIGKWQYLPMLLSDYGREIVRRKYDAIATDRAYENIPSGLLGPIGAWVDRQVLDLPLHQDLRHRLRFVVDGLNEQAQVHSQHGDGPVRILSAPCGLIRDVVTTASELAVEAPDIADRLEFHALDLDPTGEVIPLARRRAEDAGVRVSFHQANLFDQESVMETLPSGGFQIVNCIGLTPWITLEEVESLIRFFHDRVLVPGGTLVIDNFTEQARSPIADDLEIRATYHEPDRFVAALEANGFRLVSTRTTANETNTVYVATSVPIS